MRALVLDAGFGVYRAHTAADLSAAMGLHPARTRAVLRLFVQAGLVQELSGPGAGQRYRLLAGPLLQEWLLPFFTTEARLAGTSVGPRLPGCLAVRLATPDDVPAVKRLVDRHRREMGFVLRATLEAGQQRGSLWIAHDVAEEDAAPPALGYVQVHHRRDRQTTLHTIAVDAHHRADGLGRALVAAVERDCRGRGMRGILLRCPSDLPANAFYERLGFTRIRTEPGKRRPLHVWWKDC